MAFFGSDLTCESLETCGRTLWMDGSLDHWWALSTQYNTTQQDVDTR